MKPIHISNNQRFSRMKGNAQRALSAVQSRMQKRARANTPVLKAGMNGTPNAWAAAVPLVTVPFLAACTKTNTFEGGTKTKWQMVAEAKGGNNSFGTTEVLAALAIVSAAAFVGFTVNGFRTRREVPGIVGPSGLVPVGPRKDKKGNPFQDVVTDDEYARIRKETRIWGLKNKKERYYLSMSAETLDVTLVPIDFKYTFNRNTLPALVSLCAAMAAGGAALNKIAEGKETKGEVKQEIPFDYEGTDNLTMGEAGLIAGVPFALTMAWLVYELKRLKNEK